MSRRKKQRKTGLAEVRRPDMRWRCRGRCVAAVSTLVVTNADEGSLRQCLVNAAQPVSSRMTRRPGPERLFNGSV